MAKTWRARRQQKPDVYLLTFRGYEMLPFYALLIAGSQPVVFDEWINPLEVVAWTPPATSWANCPVNEVVGLGWWTLQITG